MKRNTLLLLFTAGALAVQGQDYSYDQNSQTLGIQTVTERASLEISPVRTKILEERETVLPVMGVLAAPLVNVGFSILKATLQKQAKQYQATYACGNSGDAFFESRQYANLPELTIRRSITLVDPRDRSVLKDADALLIVLEPELSSDKHAFRYRVKSVNMYYSKARTKGKYDFIDVQLDIIFRSLATDATKQEVATLRAFSLVIPSVKANTAYDPSFLPKSSWLPFPPALQLSKGVGVYDKTGPYEFLINVTESNPYKVRAENRQFVFDKSNDAISSLAAEIADLVKASNK
jgi:hypothetical protein